MNRNKTITKQLNRSFLLALTLPITVALICPSFATAPSEHHTINKIHLQQAGDLINSKHYQHGYIKYKNMAQQGCPFSQCILGIMHQNGLGTEKNAAQALYWFDKSAQQGFADAEKRLGLMYYHGNGIAKDINLAKQWLTKAANHGVQEAKELLAQIQGETTSISNEAAQSQQQSGWTVDDIEKSWQGYSDITKQLTVIAPANQTQSN